MIVSIARVAAFILVVYILSSCHTYRMLDGRSRSVFFFADPSVFNDPDFPNHEIAYMDILALRGNFVNSIGLKRDQPTEVSIAMPTFFLLHGDRVLVYPGERILIKKGKYNDFTFENEQNPKRNAELGFFKVFSDLVSRPYLKKKSDESLDGILVSEKVLKQALVEYKVRCEKVFDSLSQAYHVSRKFKELSGSYSVDISLSPILDFYKYYKDTLTAHGLYDIKCGQLAAVLSYSKVNDIDNVPASFVNDLADQILPYKLWRIENSDQFCVCFDAIVSGFSGLCRDYLLTQVMYISYKNRIQVPADYPLKYESICTSSVYKKLLANVGREQREGDQKAAIWKGDGLMAFKGRKITGLSALLNANRGKVLLLDFWASWCAPCREELPYLTALSEKYSGKVVFINISLDKEIQPWRKYIIGSGPHLFENYVFVDSHKSSFLKEYGINEIPRYILVDRSGSFVNINGPAPSNPQFKLLIDSVLTR